jgi:hypothetical protein
MKYLITESKLNSVIFNYLMSLNLKVVYWPSYVSFVYSLEDTHAVMRYRRRSGSLIISEDFINGICEFFSTDRDNAKLILTNFVEENSNAGNIESWDIKVYGGMIGDAELSM